MRVTERVNRNRSKQASTKESQILKSVWTSRHSRNNGVFTSSRKYTRGFLLLSPLAIDRYPSPPVRAFITPETNLGKRNEIEKDWEMARAASVPI